MRRFKNEAIIKKLWFRAIVKFIEKQKKDYRQGWMAVFAKKGRIYFVGVSGIAIAWISFPYDWEDFPIKEIKLSDLISVLKTNDYMPVFRDGVFKMGGKVIPWSDWKGPDLSFPFKCLGEKLSTPKIVSLHPNILRLLGDFTRLFDDVQFWSDDKEGQPILAISKRNFNELGVLFMPCIFPYKEKRPEEYAEEILKLLKATF